MVTFLMIYTKIVLLTCEGHATMSRNSILGTVETSEKETIIITF